MTNLQAIQELRKIVRKNPHEYQALEDLFVKYQHVKLNVQKAIL